MLLVPVYVGTAGPYMFAIDPDAKVSIVDDKVVKEAGLRSGQGPRLDDELDHQNPHFYAEILMMQRRHALRAEQVRADRQDRRVRRRGRAVDGVLGRDVIADSLVFGFDRDAGLDHAAHAGSVEEAGGCQGTTVHYDLLSDRNRTEMPGRSRSGGGLDLDVIPVSRKITDAMIDGSKFTVHLDFGAKTSQLRERSWPTAKLEARPTNGMLVDETGTGRTDRRSSAPPRKSRSARCRPRTSCSYRTSTRGGASRTSRARSASTSSVPTSIWANWDDNTIDVVPRHDADPRRTHRPLADASAPGCAVPGCVAASMIDPLAKLRADAPRPAQNPGVVVSFARDPSTAGSPLEALVAVKGADGAQKATLIVSLPAKADRAMTHLSGEYAGTTLSVIDVDAVSARVSC